MMNERTKKKKTHTKQKTTQKNKDICDQQDITFWNRLFKQNFYCTDIYIQKFSSL